MKKAFYSVVTAMVMAALRDQDVEESYVRLLEDIYNECTGTIILHQKRDKIPIGKGVRQGETTSPKLFTTCLESVLRKLDRETLGVRVKGECLSNLTFADGIVLWTNSVEDMQKMIEGLHKENLMVGLKINMKKPKVLSNNQAVNQLFAIGNEVLRKYMNTIISAKLSVWFRATRNKSDGELAWNG